MLLQVHDELVFDARKEELDQLKTMVKRDGKAINYPFFREWEQAIMVRGTLRHRFVNKE